jgi:hypothetical protein
LLPALTLTTAGLPTDAALIPQQDYRLDPAAKKRWKSCCSVAASGTRRRPTLK